MLAMCLTLYMLLMPGQLNVPEHGSAPTDSLAAEAEAQVARLGSARYAEREAAAARLERLGRVAMPPLRAARDAHDPEVRSRAVALINKIEGTLLTQPTLLSLDFEDQPLREVIEALGTQAGIKLSLVPDNDQFWRDRRVTIHESAPLSFWKGMDRFCELARLQYNPLAGMQRIAGSREPVFPLYNAHPRPGGPTSDSGPFRVSLLGVHYRRDYNYNQVMVGAAFPPMPPQAIVPGMPRPLSDPRRAHPGSPLRRFPR